MATDVSSLVRILNNYNEEQRRKQEQIKNTDQGKSMSLITRDLLGGSCSSSSSISEKELDLDLQVPNGWEKRLDMKSGNIYIQKCNPSPSNHQQTSILHQEIHDLNSKSSTTTTKSKDLLREEEETLDLKLQLVVPSYDYQSSSVCTLDKVKSALERVQTESSSSSLLKKRTLTVSTTTTTTDTKISNGGIASSSSCSSSSPSSSSSEGVMFAAGCPGCLSYVLISNKNPNCPRCDCKIPSKKPRIDLNLSV